MTSLVASYKYSLINLLLVNAVENMLCSLCSHAVFQDIVVKRVSLPRGARLTIDQVNYQVLECIDVLSEAKEHVSMERLESMLLEKYQVG